MLDLYGASRDELVALVLALREQNADLARRLAEQQAEVATLRAAIADLTARVGEALGAAGHGAHAAGARLRPPPDGADGPPGACRRSLPELPQPPVRRDGGAHPRG